MSKTMENDLKVNRIERSSQVNNDLRRRLKDTKKDGNPNLNQERDFQGIVKRMLEEDANKKKDTDEER